MLQKIFYHSKKGITSKSTRLIWYFSAFFFFMNIMFISRKFGNPTVEQFIFHLQFGVEGLDFSKALARSYFMYCIFTPTFAASFLVVLEETVKRFLKPRYHKTYKTTRWFIGKKLPIYIFIFAVITAFSRFSVLAFFSDVDPKDDYIKNNYVDPKKLEITAKRPKNLVLIYGESLEKSYAEEKLFRKGLLKDLDDIPGVEFKEFRQMPGTGWTIAGITASQCALPLKSVGFGGGNQQGEIFHHFLPGATCLGDTLKSLGYTNVFLGGASLNFAGKGKFFKTHGYEKTMGNMEWILTGRHHWKKFNGWGLYDDDLMEEAKLELDRLHAEGKPFNLTILTVDTHFPKGFLSRSCTKEGGQDFEDIVRCTATAIAGLIRYAESKGYLEDTRFVVLGDHLTMPNPVFEKLTSIGNDRIIYNKWFGKSDFKQNRDQINHFDIAPTILEFLDITVPGDRFGLGYSAFNTPDVVPAPTRFDDIRGNVLKRSGFYNDLWIPVKK